MSQQELEVVQAMMEAFLRRDWPEANSALSRDIVWDVTRIAETVPDVAGVYRGLDEGTRFWAAWMSPWEKLSFEYDLRAVGDQVVVLIRNQRQWGRHSGAVTRIPDYVWLFTLADGEVVRGCWYPDHQSGLEAAGVSE
jgi:ketosteroid isomerase-like protein